MLLRNNVRLTDLTNITVLHSNISLELLPEYLLTFSK